MKDRLVFPKLNKFFPKLLEQSSISMLREVFPFIYSQIFVWLSFILIKTMPATR